MSFKKKLGYSDAPIIIGDSTSDKDLFRPGFSYMIEDVIYTVIKDVTQDVTAQMRKVVLADGTFEIIAVESIKKDIHSYTDGVVLTEQFFWLGFQQSLS